MCCDRKPCRLLKTMGIFMHRTRPAHAISHAFVCRKKSRLQTKTILVGLCRSSTFGGIIYCLTKLCCLKNRTTHGQPKFPFLCHTSASLTSPSVFSVDCRIATKTTRFWSYDYIHLNALVWNSPIFTFPVETKLLNQIYKATCSTGKVKRIASYAPY